MIAAVENPFPNIPRNFSRAMIWIAALAVSSGDGGIDRQRLEEGEPGTVRFLPFFHR
jgi:hypothetical protein